MVLNTIMNVLVCVATSLVFAYSLNDGENKIYTTIKISSVSLLIMISGYGIVCLFLNINNRVLMILYVLFSLLGSALLILNTSYNRKIKEIRVVILLLYISILEILLCLVSTR